MVVLSQRTLKWSQPFLIRARMTLPKTGDIKVVLMVSRTKVHADHAGLSVPLLVLSTLTGEPQKQDTCWISPSSSLFIAIPDHTDVMVVSTPAPGTTSNLTHR